jgi:thiol-disulfide isomerase/thioredoxin
MAETEQLETMRPEPTFDADAYESTVAAFAALPEDATVKVWGGDWCKDCRAALPGFAAALDAAGFLDRAEHYPVERVDGEKVGPGVEEYDVELIPTIVIEVGGEEVARFVESEPTPAAQYLAERLRGAGVVS